MKNITDYLVDEGSYEEDILLGNNVCLARMLNMSLELCVSMSLDTHRNSIANCHHIASSFLARVSIYAIARYMPSPVRLSVHHTGGSVKDSCS